MAHSPLAFYPSMYHIRKRMTQGAVSPRKGRKETRAGIHTQSGKTMWARARRPTAPCLPTTLASQETDSASLHGVSGTELCFLHTTFSPVGWLLSPFDGLSAAFLHLLYSFLALRTSMFHTANNFAEYQIHLLS